MSFVNDFFMRARCPCVRKNCKRKKKKKETKGGKDKSKPRV